MNHSEASASQARLARRAQLADRAKQLIGFSVGSDFDAHHAPLCPIDIAMVVGHPWLEDGLKRDFVKDESGYRKIGGGANTPERPYYYRSTANLIYYLKRQGFYYPRGSKAECVPGMLMFFDWSDRGRFNFTPDRCGVLVQQEGADQTIVTVSLIGESSQEGYAVQEIHFKPGDDYDRAWVGFSDFP